MRTGNGPVILYTSSSVDWVIEYAGEDGVLHIVNLHDDETAEQVQLAGRR